MNWRISMSDLDETQFDDLMREAAADYRPPPEPRVEAMWQTIEARSFGPRQRPWWNRPLALAATLILGLGIGFLAGRARPGSTVTPEVAATPPEPRVELASSGGATPFVGVATNYLQQMTALLIAVAGDLESGRVPGGTIDQARGLLSTTRLLLDSGIQEDRLRDLLEDLELVLAQVVRIRNNAELPEAALITQALNEREVLPRLTYYLADNSVAP
jgi:hypothetical protein